MLLERINSPADLRGLTVEQLPELAGEIRRRILEVVSANGGHLASSLGAVELAIALHYCLDTPRDKIVWDVGHQTYAHKIITGRNSALSGLRRYGGLSGFPCKEESEFDLFTTGHSSTAVSLALGLACAGEIQGPDNKFRAAAVIGDGSLSGGLCFEGLNNAGHLKKDLLVVLNTNEMSIAPNVGSVSTYINKIISLPLYNRFRNSLEAFLNSRVPRGKRLLKLANKFEEGLKGLFIPGVFFEELGFRYFGPFDGNNLSHLVPALKKIIAFKGPLFLHVITKKGKGFAPAEKDPVRFHSTGPFDLSGEKKREPSVPSSPTYTSVFGRKMTGLAGSENRLAAITAAMAEGTGLDSFRDKYPQRFFDVGIAEGHAVCFAAGLARQGMIPVVAIYSTFLQRAYDQIIESVALQGLHVVFAMDRAGLVGDDGPTHQGIFDIAFLRNIPNMTVLVPADAEELEMMLDLSLTLKKPVALRYPKTSVCLLRRRLTEGKARPIELGKAEILREGGDFAVFALGSVVSAAEEAAVLLEAKGLSGSVVNARFVKPLDAALLARIAGKSKLIFTVEDGIIEGGFGSAVEETLGVPVTKMGVPEEFPPCAKRQELLERYGLDAAGIAARIAAVVRK
ncbi:MAG: 1-deoxy-D-xylulose-5-phosphate synthase [Candidatus Omnitrophota bacterium]